MTDVVHFVIYDNEPRQRIEAYLGQQIVGEIRSNPLPAEKGALGECNAYYRIFLPVSTQKIRPASSVKTAQRHMLQWLAGWFEAAGPAFTPIMEAIGEQALLFASEDKSEERAMTESGLSSGNELS